MVNDNLQALRTPASISQAVSYAFQPIVTAGSYDIVGFEALLRGAQGASAHEMLSSVPADELNRFDRDSRTLAVRRAAQLGLGSRPLNLNMRSSGLLDAQLLPIDALIGSAQAEGLSVSQVLVEITEEELISDYPRFAQLINQYRSQGVRYVIDDFGAGYSGLNMLATFQPDQLKLDMHLVRGISTNGPRQAIVRAVRSVCTDLGIDLVAEGVETLDELHWLEDAGVEFFQGYLFARPALDALPSVQRPAPRSLPATQA